MSPTLRFIARLAFACCAAIGPSGRPVAAQPPTVRPAPADSRPVKRLIEFGWDEPDTAFLRAHIEEMERTPFDGCVFHVNYVAPDGKNGNFTWEGWGRRSFAPGEVSEALRDLKALPIRRFRQNFLRFNTTPADLDWFDDHAAVLNNARLSAQLAREGRARGVLFDIEQYQGKLFDYRAQRDVKTRSWDAYAQQARRRGREVMDAFQEGYPDVTVLLTFGYTLPWSQSEGGKRPLAECDYGLLAPFLDGMVEAARGRARLVDGHELSYGYRDRSAFDRARQTFDRDVLPVVADPEAYCRVVSLGFGIWLDHDWRSKGWNVEDVARNHFSPEGFETSVRSALETADEFVWIYTEQPRWWTEAGGTVNLPSAYEAALRKSREPRPK